MTNLEVAKEMFENGKSIREISRTTGIQRRTIDRVSVKEKWERPEGFNNEKQKILNKEFVLTAPKPLSIKEELVANKQNALIKSLQDRNKQLLEAYDELSINYDMALELKQFPQICVSNQTYSKAKHYGIPIIQWSDWHVEEKVDKRTVRDKNEFNPTICRKRVDTLAHNTVKLIEKERQNVTIDTIAICLGGDFINNYLHEHDVQENYMSPLDACSFAIELLKTALVTVAKYANVKEIIIMCIRGNHPRLTKKMQSSNDFKMNFETMIYNMLKIQLSDALFTWHLPESELGYMKLFDKQIRCFHGHQIRYMGGVGGLTIPLNKMIMNWDKTDKADFNLCHHFHTYSSPIKSCNVNGSLVGFNSYALSCGFSYEPAQQSFQLLDSKRGFTVKTPIFCE